MFGRLTPTVKYILIANVGIFVLQSLLNLPLSSWLGLRVVFSDQFALHQFITYMWIHANFSHLLGNMFAVFVFGPLLEQTFGQKISSSSIWPVVLERVCFLAVPIL